MSAVFHRFNSKTALIYSSNKRNAGTIAMGIAWKMTASSRNTQKRKKLMKTLNLIDRQNELIKSFDKCTRTRHVVAFFSSFSSFSAYFYWTIEMIVSPLFELI